MRKILLSAALFLTAFAPVLAQAVVIPPQYDDITPFNGGIARVGNSSMGIFEFRFIDQKGNEPFRAKFDDMGTFSEGLAAVITTDQWGYINRLGEEVIIARYD